MGDRLKNMFKGGNSKYNLMDGFHSSVKVDI